MTLTQFLIVYGGGVVTGLFFGYNFGKDQIEKFRKRVENYASMAVVAKMESDALLRERDSYKRQINSLRSKL